MYIEDAELRDIYKSATTERLQKLEATVIHLEKHPSDRAQLEAFLREAHTLKGDSRMLGIKDVETLTHQIEDCMADVKRGERVITPDLCDRIYHGIDAIRKLVREAVTGEKAGVNVFLVLAQLMGSESNGNEAAKEKTNNVAEEFPSFDESLFSIEPESNPQPVAIQEIKVASSSKPPEEASLSPTTEGESLDTIRVEASKLDALMRQAGELNIAKLRVARRMSDVEELLKLYEEWNRDTAVNRSALRQLQNGLQNGQLKQVQDFWKRAELRLEKLGNLVNELKVAAYEDTTSLESITNELESGIQNLRLLPLSTIFNLFPRMVRDLAKQQGKQVKLEIEGGQTRVDKRIIEEMKDPLLHILRNAIDHGIETPQERESKGKLSRAIVRLRGYQSGDNVVIEIIDDGRGLDIEAIKQTALQHGIASAEELDKMSTTQIQSLIFSPGFSTRTEVTEISGRGIGLDVVRANVERLKGNIQVESSGKGCEFRLRLSTNLATTDVLITEVAKTPYAVPLEFVEQMLLISRQEIFALEGSQTITFSGQPVSVVWLTDILELPVTTPTSPTSANTTAKIIPCIILKIGTERLGLLVDALRDRQEIVLKPQSKLLKRIRNISGATILGDGQVCMVVNPQDFLKSVRKGSGAVVAKKTEETRTRNKLLLVEDSIIIRTQMKRLLEGAGYEITIAVDGIEGFNKLRAGSFDAVVSDVEMPNLNGLQLTTRIRQFPEYQELPIILVTTLASDEDKRRGAEAGANAYLTKGDFDQKILIETLKRLV